jgi:putative inorganic carbon (hco3(-)) transporter
VIAAIERLSVVGRVQLALLAGSLLAAGGVLGHLSAVDPAQALAASAGAAVLAVLLPRPLLATAALAGSFFYDDYFTERFGFWNPGKLLGLLAVVALGISLLRDRRPLVWAPQVPIIVVFGGVIGISHTFARDPSASVQTVIRYVLFFGLFFIVLQVVRSARDLHVIMDVLVLAGAVAALYGLDNMLFHGWDRAAGPLLDPGDFGLQLATVVPFAAHRIRTTDGLVRIGHGAAAVVLVAAVLGSFSRASLLGLAVAAIWAIATRRLPLRVGVALVVVALGVVLVAVRAEPETIRSTFTQKQDIADQNVESRFVLWDVAFGQWQSSPVFGVGPGNFVVRFPEHASPFRHRVETTHNAYLNVLAELGTAGFLAFAAFVVVSWREVRTRARASSELRTAVAVAFLVAALGALFMTQQFYPPLWFLGAVGAALNRASTPDLGPPAATDVPGAIAPVPA